jgi:hypothetical protein
MRSIARRRITLATLIALLGPSVAAEEGRVASDTELRVAYCLGIIDWDASHLIGPAGNADGTPLDQRLSQEFANQRSPLSAYLAARGYATGERPVSALVAALKAKREGADDAQQFNAA